MILKTRISPDGWVETMPKHERTVRYYADFTTDFYANGKESKLPEGYRWIREGRLFAIWSALIYGAALLFSLVYCRLFLHLRIKGKDKLAAVKGKGYFLYGNHTQPIGDVFMPALVCFPARIYTIVSPANLTLPFIGKLLPALGALPLAQTLHGVRNFNQAVEGRLKEGHPIILYPEAHVWDYYTDIRPFDASSFKLPVRFGVPAFCMTTTYQKRRFGKKPRITLFIDGPFYAEGENNAQKSNSLHNQVKACMTERAKESNFAFIEYRRSEDNPSGS